MATDGKPGGYTRDEFGQKWADVDRNGCDQRNEVLRRDMVNLHTVPGTRGCVLAKGILSLQGDSYAAKRVRYKQGGDKIQIDHVVSLADAWRSGAHAWSINKRQKFANDFMELEAVDAHTNEDKRRRDGCRLATRRRRPLRARGAAGQHQNSATSSRSRRMS
jgi:hypothetical protein